MEEIKMEEIIRIVGQALVDILVEAMNNKKGGE